MDRYINIAAEFSPHPRGRDDQDNVGPFHGQAFRARLAPLLRAGDRVTVDFGGVDLATPSFVEEVFGGLIREGLTLSALERNLIIKSEDNPSREKTAWRYIREASEEFQAV